MSSLKPKKIQHNRHGLVACDRPGGIDGARRWYKHLWVANENEYTHASMNEERADLHTEDQIKTKQTQSTSSESPPSTQKIIPTSTPGESYPLTIDDKNPSYVPFSPSTSATKDPIVSSPILIPWSNQSPYHKPSPNTFDPSSQYSYHEPRHAFVPSDQYVFNINDHDPRTACPTRHPYPGAPFMSHEASNRVARMPQFTGVNTQTRDNNAVFLSFNPPTNEYDTPNNDCMEQQIIVSPNVQNDDFHQIFFEFMNYPSATRYSCSSCNHFRTSDITQPVDKIEL